MLIEALDAIAATELLRMIRSSTFIYPLLSAAHVTAIGLLLGAITVWDVMMLRGETAPSLANSVAGWGLGVAIATGVVLFLCRGGQYAVNPAFQFKIALLSLAALNIVSERIFGRQMVAAALSLLLWPAIIIAGRYIAFT